MKAALFDTHADTPYEMYKKQTGLRENGLHISLDKTKSYSVYFQCMAIWSDKALSDEECFYNFKKIHEHLMLCLKNDDGAKICKSYDDILCAHKDGKAAFMLTVEDARLLSGEIKRLEYMREMDVRMLTLQWQGKTIIGGGFDTDAPLTNFGCDVVRKCAELGIIPDISHANERTAREIIDIASEMGSSVIASHSNSRAICDHERNMTDNLYHELVKAGGIVGISLAPQHLTVQGTANAECVFTHIDHYAEREGIGHICLGCDLDGIETTPIDIRSIEEVERIAECMLKHNYKEEYVHAVFSENARRFLADNLK